MFEEFFEDFKRMQKEMDRLFKDMSKIKFPEFKESAMDIYEENGKLIIKVDMPGVNKEDIDLAITEDSISIKAERKEKKIEEKENIYKAERRYKGYNIYQTLPVEVNPETAKAEYKNGVLTVEVEKSEKEKKKAKKVEIQ